MNLTRKIEHALIRLSRQRQFLLTLGLIGATTVVSLLIFVTAPQAAPTTNLEKAWPVSISQAEPTTLRPNFVAYGRLESNRTARLRSDLVARVDEVLVREGDWVNAGDVLVQLDTREANLAVLEHEAEVAQFEATLAAAQVRLRLARQNTEHYEQRILTARTKLQRHQDLFAQRLISKSLLDDVSAMTSEESIEFQSHQEALRTLPNDINVAGAQLKRAQALLEKARYELDKTTVRAPFAGPITAVHAAPGDHSNLSAILVEVAAAEAFEVRVQIPERYIAQFDEAIARQQALVATDAHGQSLHLDRLANHLRAGQSGLDAFFTYGEALPAHATLGAVLNLAVELPPQPGLIAIPVQALYDNKRIYTVENSRLLAHKVERVGERQTAEGEYQLLVRSAQIPQGANILTTQLPRPITGLLVQVAASP
ncbi:MAG: HlyD family efflux transporter periplasmic adaptor subunit [Pseudomonadota bacterium]